MKNIKIAIDTSWKLVNEILMYLCKPFVMAYLFFSGVEIGPGAKFYGFPRVYRYRGSRIKIGNNFECRSWWFSNPIGINHPAILCTWAKSAELKIGNDVGISGGSIVASSKVEIGDGTIIGANSLIVDTDFHPLKSSRRRYEIRGVKSYPIRIGKNVFIGTSAIILKGVEVKDDKIIPAGRVIRHG